MLPWGKQGFARLPLLFVHGERDTHPPSAVAYFTERALETSNVCFHWPVMTPSAPEVRPEARGLCVWEDFKIYPHKAPGETLLHVSREVITHAANMLQPIAPLTARLPQPPLDATDTSNGHDGCRWRELWQGTAPLSSFFSSVRSIHSSLAIPPPPDALVCVGSDMSHDDRHCQVLVY